MNERQGANSHKLGVVLISGGRSGEHEVSLRSAASIRNALDTSKYDIRDIFIDKEGKWHPEPIRPEPGGNPGMDVIFPVLHGTFGEDGTIQGLLELADLPYVGAGVMASSVAMDKAVMKDVCSAAGLPVVEHVVLTKGTFDPKSVKLPFEFPVFVKPANLGSSVGISKAKSAEDLEKALGIASEFDRKIIVERGIKGREFECAVLGGRSAVASIACEIIPSQEFYTYEDKYVLNEARIDLPAKLSEAEMETVRGLAVRCFEAVNCEGMARVDFLMESESGKFFINEINTIPGFTSVSMFPRMWEFSGISYSELVDRLIELALERSETRRELRYSR